MISRIGKWRNSFALPIPSRKANKLQLEEGKATQISIENGASIIRPDASTPAVDLNNLLDEITAKNLHRETTTGAVFGNEF